MSEEQPAAPPAEEVPVEETAGEEEEEPAPPPRRKLNMGKFGYDYSEEEDTMEVIQTGLWEVFDSNTHSFWIGKSKPEDYEALNTRSSLQLVNRIGGYYRYLDRLGGKAFCCGVVLQHQETGQKEIHMLWLFQGKRVSRELKKETICGEGVFFLFDWEKLDADDPDTRELINKYLMWEEEIGDYEFQEGKIFT